MQAKINDLLVFYRDAWKFVAKNFPKDIDWANNLPRLEQIENTDFFCEYVWVVLCSGFSVRGARKIYDKWYNEPTNFEIIKHPLKQKAIKLGFRKFHIWFEELKKKKNKEEILDYLETLPHIGKITKYHLAKNLGLDIAKPDVHLQRIMKAFGFDDVQLMCQTIQHHISNRISVIDTILWRYCEQNPDYVNKLQQTNKHI